MEVKKVKEANVERFRKPLFYVGLLFVGSATLAALSYQSPFQELEKQGGMRSGMLIDIERVTIEDPRPEKQPLHVEERHQLEITEETTVKGNENDTVTKSSVVIEFVHLPDLSQHNAKVVDIEIIEIPDYDPSFEGGFVAMQKWIAKEVVYPESAILLGEKGKVFVSFVVENDGTITNVQVERGISEELDREAKRVVRAMPKWIPGEHKGKKVRSRMRLPIVFDLN